jgi:WAS family protein 1
MDDLPQALPSLPGIADDIEFNISDEEFLSATIPNLNGIIGIIPQLPEIIGSDSTLLTNTQTKQEFSPSIKPSISTTIAQSSESEPSPVPPPPPPPPPPPSPPPITTKEITIQPQKQINTQTVQTNSENSTQFIPTVDTNRASLLDSIRAAAGKPKKSTNIVIARKIEAKKNKQKEVVSGDLMSDLFNKLSMRRKGISGANVSSDSQTSAMERISAMIPPPPPVSNEDNDNNDDWE